MKLTIQTEQLRKALKLADCAPGGAITDDNVIRLNAEKKRLTCTRINQSSTLHAIAECKAKKEGEANINAKTIGEMLANIRADEVTMELKDDVLNVSTDSALSKFKTIQDSLLTQEPEVGEPDTEIAFKAGQLKSLLDITTPAMGNEAQKRPFTEGVTLQFMEGNLYFIGSDSRRFHMANSGLEDEIHELIPAKVCESLLKICNQIDSTEEVKLGITDNGIFFSSSICKFRSQKLEVAPFDYTKFPIFKLVPISKITVKKPDLISAIKLAIPFGYDLTKLIELSIAKGKLEIKANTQKDSECEQEIEGQNTGESHTALSANYLMDAINATNGSTELTLVRTEVGSSSAMFMQDDERFLMVMGVRTQVAEPMEK